VGSGAKSLLYQDQLLGQQALGLYGPMETLQNEGPTSYVTSAAIRVVTSLPQQGLGSLLPKLHLCRREAGDVGAETPARQRPLGSCFPPAPLNSGVHVEPVSTIAYPGLTAACRALSLHNHLLLPPVTFYKVTFYKGV